jgi:dTDP-4-dehydrorhamnose reductase
LAGETYLNRLKFTHLIAEVFDQKTDCIEGVATHELSQDAPRPRHAGLHSTKANSLIGHSLLGAKAGLERLLNSGVV